MEWEEDDERGRIAAGRDAAARAVRGSAHNATAAAITMSLAGLRSLVGVLLWLAAIRLFWHPSDLAAREIKPVPVMVALPIGAGLGLLAGLTGTGGGIFLSPLLILFGWADARRTSGIVAGFILLNSIAGLVGNVASIRAIPAEIPIFVVAVVLGAIVGTWLGTGRLPKQRLLQGLGLVLVIAGVKLIFT